MFSHIIFEYFSMEINAYRKKLHKLHPWKLDKLTWEV